MRADERAHEPAVDLREHGSSDDARLVEELPRIGGAVDACRFDVDCFESRARSASAVAVFLERAGDAADPELHAAPKRLPACRRPRTTTSDTAKRPPGFSTRKASAMTRSLSADRLITQFEMITSTELSGSGMLLDLALQELDVRRARTSAGSRARARASRRSCPGRRPCRSGRRACAESSTSMPPPEPRSSTISPGFSSASAVGLPQPSEASSASAGIAAAWRFVVEIRRDRIGSQHADVPHPHPPSRRCAACSAASPYFC